MARHTGLLEPCPTWREFLTAQAESVIGCDFAHTDLVDLRRVYALVFLDTAHADCVAGVTAHPTASWTAQQARNLAGPVWYIPSRSASSGM